MLLPTHVVVGWLAARVGGFGRRATLWALAGSVVPDLIDKPLGAATSLTYQTVGHSAVGATAVAALVAAGRLPRAFLVGWLAHLAADTVQLTANARGEHAADILRWPFVTPEGFVIAESPAPHLAALEPLADALAWVPVPILQEGYLTYYVTTPGFLGDCLVWLAAAAAVVAGRRD